MSACRLHPSLGRIASASWPVCRRGPSAMPRRPAASRPTAMAADWRARSSGSVANSWAAVTVAGTTTTSSSMGGLVGWNNGRHHPGQLRDRQRDGRHRRHARRWPHRSEQRQHPQELCHGSGERRQPGSWRPGRFQQASATAAHRPATIVNSHATGAVTTTALGGGLVGTNGAGTSIDKSYATGAVNVTSSTIAALMGGGLVANNSGAITKSYATGAVNVTSTYAAATATSAGGLIGINGSTATVTQSYATGAASAVSAAGVSMAGGLIGRNIGGATVMQSYATGAAPRPTPQPGRQWRAD